MSLTEIINSSSLGIILFFTLIQLSPIKINPWSKVFKWIGNVINEDILVKLKSLEKELSRISSNVEKYNAINSRVRILRFGNEIKQGILHTKDYFDQIMQDIDIYENYCNINKEFRNSITSITVEIITNNYRERLEKNDFL